MATWQLFGSPHFFHPSWVLPQNCFLSGSLCLFYWGFGELRKRKNQQSVVRHMENHMLHKTAYVLCLRCKERYAKINTCQLQNLPRFENSKSLCSYAKYTACFKFHRLLKLKELIQGLQIQTPMGTRKVIQMSEVGQVGPWELGGGGAA